MNRNQSICCALAFVAGVLFLLAAPQYAKVATNDTPKESALWFAFGIPAMVFTLAGICGVIGAVIGVILCLQPEPKH